MSVATASFPTTTIATTVYDQYGDDNHLSLQRRHRPSNNQYEQDNDTAIIQLALDAGKRLLEAGGSTYLPFTLRTAKELHSRIFQHDNNSAGGKDVSYTPGHNNLGQLHQYLRSLESAAYAETREASRELLDMGPQLRELDKRYEGELSRAFADILQAQQTVSSSQSKVRLEPVLIMLSLRDFAK